MKNCKKHINCFNCLAAGYCVKLKTQSVTLGDIKNPHYLYDFLKFAHSLNLNPSIWNKSLHEWNFKYEGIFFDENGKEIFMDLELFDVDEDTLFFGTAKDVSNANERIRDFFGYWFGRPHSFKEKRAINEKTAQRLCVVASILKAKYHEESLMWGREGKTANDNNRPAANDNDVK